MPNGLQRRAVALYEGAVRECQAAGVELAAMDYADLWGLAREAVGVDRDGTPRFLAPDVTVADGVVLHCATVGCMLWWEEYGAPTFEGNPREEVIGQAWMLANATDEALFRRTTKPEAVRKAVRRWAWKIPWHVTPTDLAWGVAAVLGSPDVPADARVRTDPSSLQWGELVAGLARDYHVDPSVVAWQWPVGRVTTFARARNKDKGAADSVNADTFLALRRHVTALKRRQEGVDHA